MVNKKSLLFLFLAIFVCIGFSTNLARAYSPGDVLINEFRLDGTQWIEILNTTANDIDLSASTWNMVTTEAGPAGVSTTTLSGLLPAHGLITFAPTTTLSTTYQTLLDLENNDASIYAMSYGSSTPFVSEDVFDPFPAAGESVVRTGVSTWSATSTENITQGWYNEAPAPTITSIISLINAGGIVTNMSTSTDNTVVTGLYFEKRTTLGDPATALGRLTFAGPLNLTNASTTALLQDLGTKMQAAAGSMNFDARTATDLKNAGASVSMYQVNTIGYNVSNISTSSLTVKDDAGLVLTGGSLPTFTSISTSSSNGGTFTFTTSHFTQFGFNPILAEVTPVITPIISTSPSYTFSSNVAGTVIFGGACSMTSSASTTIGNNVVVLGLLTPATYSNCTVKVIDGAGASSTLAISQFIIIARHDNSVTTSSSGSSGSTVVVTPIATATTTAEIATSTSATSTIVVATTVPEVVVTPVSVIVKFNFAKDLQLGSKGDDVSELQKVLVSEGYLNMPNGVAYGYFGNITKIALIKYQKAKGITPRSGVVGPKTRQVLNSTTSQNTQDVSGMSLKQLIEMLLQIGAISSDKIDAAKKMVGIQ